MMLLSLLANAHGQVVSGPHSPIITVETTGLGLPEARYVDGDFESSRILHDLDQNGWCNLWCALFEVDPAQLTSISDLDQDGMTDYCEMILMQNPRQPDPLPRNRPAIAPGSSTGSSQILWAEKAALIQEGLQATLRAKEAPPIHQHAPADVLAATEGLSSSFQAPEFPDQSAGHLYDSHSARITRADALWPGGSAPFEDATGASPLPPANPLPKIGIWDEGLVSNTRLGLAGRIFEGPGQTWTPDEAAHTLAIAEIIALADQDPANPGNHQDRQGLAWEAELELYTDANDYAEMTEAARHDPENTKFGMTFSNHSYSPGAGWVYRSNISTFEWWGPLSLGENEEDPEFGAYTVNSRAIDSIVYHAQTYLPVFSSGNSANQGGPLNGETYTAVVLVPDPANPGQVIQNLLTGQTAPRVGTAGPPLYPDPNGGNPDPDFPNPVEVNQSLEQDFAIGKGIGPGLDTIKSTGVAKNNLTVGAIYTASDEFDPQAESVGLSHFSSRGPIDDGRIKPDLVAPSTFEPIPPGGFRFGGTSNAVPAVVGTLALLQEINADSAGPRYLASSWKALLLNTAMDCTDLSYLLEEDPGTGPIVTRVTNYFGIKPQVAGATDNPPLLVGPDYFFGWGLVDAEAAASLLVKNLRSGSGAAHLCEHTLYDPSDDADDANNLTVEIPFEWDGESSEIRAMLCWSDPPFQNLSPSTLGEGNFDPEVDPADDRTVPKNLVNDLDLWIVDPIGNTHRPWCLNKDTPFAPATRDPNVTNDLDNVEQVVIENPIAGTYFLKVSHKGTLIANEKVEGTETYRQVSGREQHFSLCLSGNLNPEPARPGLTLLERLPRTATSEYVTFEIEGFVGLYYQLESSGDLVTWTDEVEVIGQQLPAIPVTGQAPFTVTILREPLQDSLYYRIKEVTPPNPN